MRAENNRFLSELSIFLVLIMTKRITASENEIEIQDVVVYIQETRSRKIV